ASPMRGIGNGRSWRAPKKEAPTLTVGDLVTHDSFGIGRVQLVEGGGDKTKARIDFGADIGEKDFLVKYAPCEKLSALHGSPTRTGPPVGRGVARTARGL